MRSFHITARTGAIVHSYDAIAHTGADAVIDAIDRFGVCSVSAIPA
jgi:hypothetical protein